MAREKICGIYQLKNRVNGKIYIGQSIDIYDRWTRHKNASFYKNGKDYNILLYRAIRKYGWDNFEKTILEICTQEDLDDKERYYIEKFKSYDTNKIGYNLRYGGQNGARCSPLSEEAKMKISQANKGRKWTEEHRQQHIQKMSGANSPNAIKVYCDGKWFPTIKDCAEYCNVSPRMMACYLNKTEKMPWRLYELDLHKEDETRDDYELTSRIPIICENMEFETVKELAIHYNTPSSSVVAWLSHRNRMPLEWYNRGLRRANESMENYEIQE